MKKEKHLLGGVGIEKHNINQWYDKEIYYFAHRR